MKKKQIDWREFYGVLDLDFRGRYYKHIRKRPFYEMLPNLPPCRISRIFKSKSNKMLCCAPISTLLKSDEVFNNLYQVEKCIDYLHKKFTIL